MRQVNGAAARRSPGSTLKPFLYAKAFDDGLLVPESYVLDVPTDYGGYVPENYDGTYRGRVTARDALIQSLNAPAVHLLSDEHVDDFVALLRKGGLATLDRDPQKYGLPLILGSGEVRLVDLTNLYATLAQEGRHKQVRVLTSALSTQHSHSSQRRRPPSSPESSPSLAAPTCPRAWQAAGAPSVAWKTGTSYGHRDAWSVGYSARYAIGVWAGNFDGHGEKGLSGSEFAAPLLFDLFRALENTPAPRPLRPAPSIEVCALSHQLPTEYCRDRVSIAYIPGRTRLHACDIHRPLFVDKRSGERLAGDCIASVPHKQIVAAMYPPSSWPGGARRTNPSTPSRPSRRNAPTSPPAPRPASSRRPPPRPTASAATPPPSSRRSC